MSRISILLFYFILVNFSASEPYRLSLMNQERGAACLDGSPPAIYINQGKGYNKNKYLIFMNGGGSCAAGKMDYTLE